MTSPSQLSLAHDGNDSRKVCLLQDPRARDFVQLADVEKITEASEMEDGLVVLHDVCMTFQSSTVVRTTAWYTFSLVSRLIPFFSQTFTLSLPKVLLALETVLFISESMLALWVSVLPRYVKVSTARRGCLFTDICSLWYLFPGAG